jgi:hypothetical protein
MLARIASMIASEQYNIRNTYWSIAGEFHSEEDKTWIIDIDWKDFEGKETEISYIEDCAKSLQSETGREPMLEHIPTKNGIHIITRPFNLQSIKKEYPGLDIHKDNPTILYCP